MGNRSEHRHQARSLLRAVLLAVVAALVPAVILESDLLVLPAAALVLLAAERDPVDIRHRAAGQERSAAGSGRGPRN